jgi:hypothetical protein
MAKRKPKAAAAGTEAKVAAAGEMRTARVTLQGHGQADVEIAADAPNPETAAIEAFKQLRGIWSLPFQPHVELDPEPVEADDASDAGDSEETGNGETS